MAKIKLIIKRKIDKCGRITLPRLALKDLGLNNGDDIIIEYENKKFTLKKENEERK